MVLSKGELAELINLLRKVQWPVQKPLFNALAETVVFVGVELCVFKGDEILLFQRPENDQFFRGFWCLPGTILRYGEKTEDAFRRLEKEEIGFKMKKEPELLVVGNFPENNRGHTFSVAYCYRVGKNFEPPRGSFFHTDDLPTNVLEEHAQLVSYR